MFTRSASLSPPWRCYRDSGISVFLFFSFVSFSVLSASFSSSFSFDEKFSALSFLIRQNIVPDHSRVFVLG
jgi:hypothetical protein